MSALSRDVHRVPVQSWVQFPFLVETSTSPTSNSKAFIKPLEMVVVDGGGAFLGGDEVALHAHDEL